MLQYILKRFLHMMPLIFGITFIGFLIIQLAPGDYFTRLKLNPQISEQTLEELRQNFGLDKPIIIQYFYWLKSILTLDFGISLAYNVPVISLIKERLFNTLILSVVSLILTWIVAIPLGILCASRQYGLSDKLVGIFAFFTMSLPTFFIAFLLVFFAVTTGILPTGGLTDYRHQEYSTLGKVWDYLKHLIIPVSVVVLSSVGGLLRLMRGYMLEELKQAYILVMRARGFSERVIKFKYALRCAINPMITIFGYQLSDVLSGVALTEIITRYPGLGRLMLEAYLAQDLYLVMASLLIGGIMLILGNLIADILLAIADPRIRYR